MDNKEIIEKMIDGKETELILDLIESTSFEIRPDNNGQYNAFDTIREIVYADGLETPSDVIEALSTYVCDNVLYYLQSESDYYFQTQTKGEKVTDFPNTCEEWCEAVSRPELQEFIKFYNTEVAEMLLLADKERIDNKVDIKDLVSKESEKTIN